MGWINTSNWTFYNNKLSSESRHARHDGVVKPQVDHVEEVTESEAPHQYNKYAKVARSVDEKDLPFIPAEAVVQRDGKNGQRLWIVIDNTVFDCTEYISRHPGGREIIQGFGGQDCSWQWWSFHTKTEMQRFGMGLRLGKTNGVQNRFQKPDRTFFRLRTSGEQW